jgi:hypothetical protein
MCRVPASGVGCGVWCVWYSQLQSAMRFSLLPSYWPLALSSAALAQITNYYANNGGRGRGPRHTHPQPPTAREMQSPERNVEASVRRGDAASTEIASSGAGGGRCPLALSGGLNAHPAAGAPGEKGRKGRTKPIQFIWHVLRLWCSSYVLCTHTKLGAHGLYIDTQDTDRTEGRYVAALARSSGIRDGLGAGVLA